MYAQRKFAIICLGILFIFMIAGCQRTQDQDPTSPELTANKQERGGPTRLSEDTSGTEIESPYYPDGTTVIVAIGDSITYGQGSSSGGYPRILENKLRTAGYNAVVINAGIRGETSPETNDRILETIAGTDMVLIMTGINDVINPSACTESFNCQTSDQIESIMDRALISNVTPVISAITPANPSDEYAWANGTIEGLNYDIQLNAAERNIIMVDNYTAILSNGGSALYVDRLHFSDQGYEVIATQWFNAIVNNKLIAGQ